MTMRHLQRTRRASAEPGAEPSAPEPGQEQLPGSGVGVLILRVWSEGTAADRQMRMRIVSREDVTSDRGTDRLADLARGLRRLHPGVAGAVSAALTGIRHARQPGDGPR